MKMKASKQKNDAPSSGSSDELVTSDEESHADENVKLPKVQTPATIDPKQARSEQQKFLDNLKAKVERAGHGDEAKKAKEREPSDEEKKDGRYIIFSGVQFHM